MSSSKNETPANCGRIIVEHNNIETLKFWVRVFELGDSLEFAKARFLQAVNFAPHKEGSTPAYAVVPIVSEYHAGTIKWIYVLVLEIDMLGICGGTGIIFFGDKAHEQQAREHRNKYADMIMKNAMERCEGGSLTEFYMTESGTQKP